MHPSSSSPSFPAPLRRAEPPPLLSRDAVRQAAYDFGVPSPPLIPITMHQPTRNSSRQTGQSEPPQWPVAASPVAELTTDLTGEAPLRPSMDNAGTTQLSQQQLAIITGGVVEEADDRVHSWQYGQRHVAQRILHFLWLGPTSVVRNEAFMRRECFTLVLIVRDAARATPLAGTEKAAAALGVPGLYVDVVAPPDGLIRAYPLAMRAVNDHMLAMHGRHGGPSSPGKVLVTCESGSERAPGVVAGYVMAMYGVGILAAVRFVNTQRLCCCFTEDVKQSLLTWDSMLRARMAVDHAPLLAVQHEAGLLASQQEQEEEGRRLQSAGGFVGVADPGRKHKRRHGEMTDAEATGSDVACLGYDDERFLDRGRFAPFVVGSQDSA